MMAMLIWAFICHEFRDKRTTGQINTTKVFETLFIVIETL